MGVGDESVGRSKGIGVGRGVGVGELAVWVEVPWVDENVPKGRTCWLGGANEEKQGLN